MYQIAVYGKGGIGKSTVSSNLSRGLASRGMRVEQVGCDPKHDSTRLLLGGRTPTTVLEYASTTHSSDWRLEDVVSAGEGGVRCVEAGGPEPGVGCAGRGILTTFDLLRRIGFDGSGCDVRVYDVLGDVVCGGFAVPMRPGYADAVYVVTSGEYMSLYAANNILRGMRNFRTETPRPVGLVFNERGSPGEAELVKAFSEATGVPVVARIPRSEEFYKAERAGRTVVGMFPGSAPAAALSALADDAVSLLEGRRAGSEPTPLSDRQLEELLRDGRVSGRGDFAGRPLARKPARRAVEGRHTPVSPLGKGPLTAVLEAGRVRDLPVVIHGPASCGYTMAQAIDDSYAGTSAPPGGGENVVTTDIGTVSSIYGGTDRLEDVLDGIAESGEPFAVVVTSCTAEIIGDDSVDAARRAMERHPGFRVAVVNGDEALSGGDAHLSAIRAVLDDIDPSVRPSEPAVNIADDDFRNIASGRNMAWLEHLFGHFGLRTGARLLWNCTVDDVRRAGSARITVMGDSTAADEAIRSKLEEKGLRVLGEPLPKGYSGTVRFIEAMCDALGRDDIREHMVEHVGMMYRKTLDARSGEVRGRRVDVVADRLCDLRWVLEALGDAGAVTSVLFVGPGSPVVGDWKGNVERFATAEEARKRTEALESDLVIGPEALTDGLALRSIGIPSEQYTQKASMALVEKVADALKTPVAEGWRSWGCGE